LYFYLSKLLSPFVILTNFLIIGILLFLIIYLKYKSKFSKFFLIFFVISFLIIGILPIGNYGLKYLESAHIQKNINLDYDNIIVLAGAESISSTKYFKILDLNNASERLIASVELALKNKNSKIFFLGGSGFLSKEDFNEADVAKMFYKNIGFDTDRVTFVDTTRNTIENLKAFKKLKINNERNLLITSAFHMNRSLFIAKSLNLNLTPYAVDFRHISSNAKFLNLYQTFNFVDNLQKINMFFREILGILVARLIL
jgi:uncharacterized SAM-binding protein YcdF (DUF218 family)